MLLRAPFAAVAAALALVLLLSATVADAQMSAANLRVRTVDHLLIVDNGVVNPKWGSNGPYSAPQSLFPLYVINLDANGTTSTEQDGPTLNYLLKYNSSDPSIITTTTDQEFGVATIALTTTQTHTRCVSAGFATLFVEMHVQDAASTVLSWSYTRRCILPLIEIGRLPWGADVVDSTQGNHLPLIEPAWKGDGTGEYPWIVQPESDSIDLFFYLANAIGLGSDTLVAPITLTLTSEDTTYVRVDGWSYNATDATVYSADSMAIFDTTQPIAWLHIPLICSPDPAVTRTMVSLQVSYHWMSGPLLLSFLKQCNSFPLQADLDVGSTPKGQDIVASGLTLQEWMAPRGMVEAADALVEEQGQ